MKTPDPKRSMQYHPQSDLDAEQSQSLDVSQERDPLDVLLAEEAEPAMQGEPYSEADDERLYTNEFIRANENASRSLFLGFLAIALIVTSFFAWMSLSRQQDPTEESVPDPVTVPNAPPNDRSEPVDIPRLEREEAPTAPSGTIEEAPSSDATEPSFVFPAQPTAPQSIPPSETEAPEENETNLITPVPEESVPPPPSVNP